MRWLYQEVNFCSIIVFVNAHSITRDVGAVYLARQIFPSLSATLLPSSLTEQKEKGISVSQGGGNIL